MNLSLEQLSKNELITIIIDNTKHIRFTFDKTMCYSLLKIFDSDPEYIENICNKTYIIGDVHEMISNEIRFFTLTMDNFITNELGVYDEDTLITIIKTVTDNEPNMLIKIRETRTIVENIISDYHLYLIKNTVFIVVDNYINKIIEDIDDYIKSIIIENYNINLIPIINDEFDKDSSTQTFVNITNFYKKLLRKVNEFINIYALFFNIDITIPNYNLIKQDKQIKDIYRKPGSDINFTYVQIDILEEIFFILDNREKLQVNVLKPNNYNLPEPLINMLHENIQWKTDNAPEKYMTNFITAWNNAIAITINYFLGTFSTGITEIDIEQNKKFLEGTLVELKRGLNIYKFQDMTEDEQTNYFINTKIPQFIKPFFPRYGNTKFYELYTESIRTKNFNMIIPYHTLPLEFKGSNISISSNYFNDYLFSYINDKFNEITLLPKSNIVKEKEEFLPLDEIENILGALKFPGYVENNFINTRYTSNVIYEKTIDNIRQDIRRQLERIKIKPSLWKGGNLSRKIIERFQSTLIENGKLVGIISAQSVGEKSTQTALRAFYTAGSSGDGGFQRLMDITNNAVVPKNPITFIALRKNTGMNKHLSLPEKVNFLETLHYSHIIESIKIEDFTKFKIGLNYNYVSDENRANLIYTELDREILSSGLVIPGRHTLLLGDIEVFQCSDWHIFHDIMFHSDKKDIRNIKPSKWILRMYMNTNILFQRKISLYTIKRGIEELFPDIRAVHSNLETGIMDIYINSNNYTQELHTNEDYDDRLIIGKKIIQKIGAILVKGVKGITKNFPYKMNLNVLITDIIKVRDDIPIEKDIYGKDIKYTKDLKVKIFIDTNKAELNGIYEQEIITFLAFKAKTRESSIYRISRDEYIMINLDKVFNDTNELNDIERLNFIKDNINIPETVSLTSLINDTSIKDNSIELTLNNTIIKNNGLNEANFRDYLIGQFGDEDSGKQGLGSIPIITNIIINLSDIVNINFSDGYVNLTIDTKIDISVISIIQALTKLLFVSTIREDSEDIKIERRIDKFITINYDHYNDILMPNKSLELSFPINILNKSYYKNNIVNERGIINIINNIKIPQVIRFINYKYKLLYETNDKKIIVFPNSKFNKESEKEFNINTLVDVMQHSYEIEYDKKHKEYYVYKVKHTLFLSVEYENKSERYNLHSKGLLMNELAALPFVDQNATYGTHTRRITALLGIEAARTYILMELDRNTGGGLNPHHTSLIADTMTYMGHVTPIKSTGKEQQQAGFFAMAGSEKMLSRFKQASLIGAEDPIISVTAQAATGFQQSGKAINDSKTKLESRVKQMIVEEKVRKQVILESNQIHKPSTTERNIERIATEENLKYLEKYISTDQDLL